MNNTFDHPSTSWSIYSGDEKQWIILEWPYIHPELLREFHTPTCSVATRCNLQPHLRLCYKQWWSSPLGHHCLQTPIDGIVHSESFSPTILRAGLVSWYMLLMNCVTKESKRRDAGRCKYRRLKASTLFLGSCTMSTFSSVSQSEGGSQSP